MTSEATDKPSIYRLLAVAGFQAYSNSLMGNAPPDLRDYFRRAHEPQVGDLVVETSTIWMPNWSPAALGWLLEVADEPVQTIEEHDAMMEEGDYWKAPGESHDAIPKERIHYIDPLDPDYASPYRWHNAGFVAIPSELGAFRADKTEQGKDETG